MADDIAAVKVASEDERRLHELGYAQELMRRMSGFSNFAVSFTIISILSGCLTLYYFGMEEGGPAIIVWGWPIVGIFTLLVGLSMAEVCSSFPTAGGLYYWAAKLSPRHGPAWSWFTGWFNFLGQVAVTAGIDFGAALFINFLFSLWFNFSVTTHWHTILIYAVVLLLHGLLNQFGIRLVALLNNVSVWWHIAGVLIIVGAMIFGLKAGAHHASAKFVFTGLENLSGLNLGWFYILPIGLLMAQYTFTGYDASAHMTEETHNASRSGPRGIVMSILISLIAGWVLAAGGALILGLPYLWNSAAYGAVTSIATIGLYVAYVAPTYLRLRQGDSFKRGPWHLGRWSYVIGWTAVTWVVIIFFLFMLPQFGPISRLTFNYAPIAVAVVIGYAGITWLVSARKWFTGPKVQGTPEELAAIERELSS